MKIITTILFASLSISTAVFAASPDIGDSVTIKANTNKSKVYVAPDESREIRGTYDLENGDTLKMTQVQNRFFAEINGKGKTEVIPTAGLVFKGKKNDIELRFSTDDAGSKVRATYQQNT